MTVSNADDLSYDVEVDVLVIGTGPAGLALSSFLSSYGINGLVVNRLNGTVKTPRAHFTNPGSLECLRDIGLEEAAMRVGNDSLDNFPDYRWANTFVGKEFVRERAFGSDPHRRGDLFEASPCKYLDLPQTELEPLLLRHATNNRWQARFQTEFVSFREHADAGFVITTLRDVLTQQEFRVKSRYLAGADGARSKVAEQLALPFIEKPGGGLAINVHYKADLSAQIKGREGLLHGCALQDQEGPPFGLLGINRVIKPWKEWLMIMLAAPGLEKITASEEEIVARAKEFIGFDPQDFELLSVSQWKINEQYASENISRGRVFCLGDAVHRHPPHNGLGSNTCIQDAYNLAWKMAYVLQGRAGPALLDTYGLERQPVGKQIVTQANDTAREQLKFFKTLGWLEPTVGERKAFMADLQHGTTPQARTRRREVFEAHHKLKVEHQAMGAELNQFYGGQGATSTLGERAAVPKPTRDTTLYYHASTFPGFRLPHAWLSKDRAEHLISTQDLAGKREFCLLTGPGGKELWSPTATAAMGALASSGATVRINVYSIGMGQDLEDVYWMWERKREVEETGVVLVRPDRYIGWRCADGAAMTLAERNGMLEQVMREILHLDKPALAHR